jgi:hypothetical protein
MKCVFEKKRENNSGILCGYLSFRNSLGNFGSGASQTMPGVILVSFDTFQSCPAMALGNPAFSHVRIHNASFLVSTAFEMSAKYLSSVRRNTMDMFCKASILLASIDGEFLKVSPRLF